MVLSKAFLNHSDIINSIEPLLRTDYFILSKIIFKMDFEGSLLALLIIFNIMPQ